MVESKALLTTLLLILGQRFRRRFRLNLESLHLIPLDKFSLRLQPILKVITEQSAADAVNLISAIQNLFNLRSLVSWILAKDFFLLRFICFCLKTCIPAMAGSRFRGQRRAFGKRR
jgi:hypothetical protein